jgi:hypothetical protein
MVQANKQPLFSPFFTFLTAIQPTSLSHNPMEKFMLIIKGGEPDINVLGQAAYQAHMQKWTVYTQKLIERGQFLAGDGLLEGGKLVQGTEHEQFVTDGPFAEAAEIVGGYYIVQAPDIQAACEIAKGAPSFELGGKVEVRPLMPGM